MMPLPTATEMRALDEDTIARLGIPGGILMESAGRGVVTVLHQLHQATKINLGQAQILVIAAGARNRNEIAETIFENNFIIKNLHSEIKRLAGLLPKAIE